MEILEILEQVRELVQQKGRITYRILKMQFQLDDETLDALKEELLFSHPEISELDGRGLVWNEPSGSSLSVTQQAATPSPAQPPQAQTPVSSRPNT